MEYLCRVSRVKENYPVRVHFPEPEEETEEDVPCDADPLRGLL